MPILRRPMNSLLDDGCSIYLFIHFAKKAAQAHKSVV